MVGGGETGLVQNAIAVDKRAGPRRRVRTSSYWEEKELLGLLRSNAASAPLTAVRSCRILRLNVTSFFLHLRDK
jgi:hypothetical protein